MLLLLAPEGNASPIPVRLDLSPWAGKKAVLLFQLATRTDGENAVEILDFAAEGKSYLNGRWTNSKLTTGDLLHISPLDPEKAVGRRTVLRGREPIVRLNVQIDSVGGPVVFRVNPVGNALPKTGPPDQLACYLLSERGAPMALPTADPFGSNALFTITFDGSEGGRLRSYLPIEVHPPDTLVLDHPREWGTVIAGPGEPIRARVPFSDFARLSLAELAMFQMKMTWHGPQFSRIPTVVITPSGDQPRIGPFLPYRTAGLFYGNDMVDLDHVALRVDQIEALIDSAAAVIAAAEEPGECFSLSLTLLCADDERSISSVTLLSDRTDLRLFRKMWEAVRDDRKAAAMIAGIAMGFYADDEIPKAIEVTDSVAIEWSGIRQAYPHGPKEGGDAGQAGGCLATLRVTNTCRTRLPRPITLLPNYPLELETPSLQLPVGPEGLAPGSSVEFVVRITADGLVRPRDWSFTVQVDPEFR